MTTMNKPSSGDTSWYQAVTDNWTAIDNDLIHKNLVTVKGDLLAASAASSPTRVPVGANGSVLVADSSQSNGVRWSTTAASLADPLMLKSFFSTHGLLPSNVIREDLFTFPAPDYQSLNGGTLTRTLGHAKIAATAAGVAKLLWDLGADYTKVLIILGGCRARQWSAGVTVEKQTSGADGWAFNADFWNGKFSLGKTVAGTGTVVAGDTTLHAVDTYAAPTFSLALYIDTNAPAQKAFVRWGSEMWITDCESTTSGAMDQARYAGVWLSPNVAASYWYSCPLGIYAE